VSIFFSVTLNHFLQYMTAQYSVDFDSRDSSVYVTLNCRGCKHVAQPLLGNRRLAINSANNLEQHEHTHTTADFLHAEHFTLQLEK